MAYFYTQTEKDEFRARFCQFCEHQADCPVWALHEVYGDQQCGNREMQEILGMFIPRNGLSNKPCAMFTEERGENERTGP